MNTTTGTFSYNPPVGYEGADSFTYTISNAAGTDVGQVNLTVSGMLWFINNSAPACTTIAAGCGRLSNPFSTLAAFEAVNGGGTVNGTDVVDPEAGDHIFIFTGSGNYTGPLTLENTQRVIGQGATTALSTLSGITPVVDSTTLPSTGGTAPTITSAGNGIVLAQNNRLHGLALSNTTGTAISGTNFGTLLTISENMSISTTTGTPIILNTGTVMANFASISANGAANGIVLTGVSGSFTVMGGTITNIAGADAATNGCADLGATIPPGVGIYLRNTSGASFTGMSFPGTFGNFGILGYGVNGFTLANVTMTGTYGNNVNQDEDTVRFCNLTGSASISGSTISNGAEGNLRVINSTGTLNRLTISNTTFGLNQNTGGDGVHLEVSGSGSTLNATITDSTFLGAREDVLSALPQAGATMNLVFGQPGAGNEVHGNHAGELAFGGGVAITPNGTMTFDLNSNTFDGGTRGVFINAASSTAVASGYFRNNTVGISGVANSGGSQSDGPALQVESNGGGDMTIVIDDNDFLQWNGVAAGVYMQVGASTGTTVNFNATVTDNLIDEPGTQADDNVIQGFQINSGTAAGESHTACLLFSGNDVDEAVDEGAVATTDVRLRQRFNTRVLLPGYTGAANGGGAGIPSVVAYIQGQNPQSPTVNGTTSTASGGGFFNTPGGAPCAVPSFP
jgi:hypothetical protein